MDFDNFDLYDTINVKYSGSDVIESNDSDYDGDGNCLHKRCVIEQSIQFCTICGVETSHQIFLETKPETRPSDLTYYQFKKSDAKGILNDIINMGFSGEINTITNDIYLQISNGKIYRGNSRKSIIFACVFSAFKIQGNPQPYESLLKMFNLDRKNGLKGLKIVNGLLPKDSIVRTTRITPYDLIKYLLQKFNVQDEYYASICKMYDEIENKSVVMSRSRPSSTIAGLIYYYILLHNKNITMSEYLSKIELSELTIKKIVKQIDVVRGTNLL
jgi:hypothetical protein